MLAIEDLKFHLAINPAVTEIVDQVAEGGDVGVFAAVDDDLQQIKRAEIQKLVGIETELVVAALVPAEVFAVEVHFGDVGDAFKNDVDDFPAVFFVEEEFLFIMRDTAAVTLSRVIERKQRKGVGKVDGLVFLGRRPPQILGKILVFEPPVKIQINVCPHLPTSRLYHFHFQPYYNTGGCNFPKKNGRRDRKIKKS